MTTPAATLPAPDTVLHFWFKEASPKQHFSKDPAFDASIRDRFLTLHSLAFWLLLAALVIVLDQFSRNLYRNDPRAFAQDGMALVLAQEAVRQGADLALEPAQRAFLYMPYMHSESARVQVESVRLFEASGLTGNIRFAHAHKRIIDRFGRYPHRNAALGRPSSAEEQAFLQEPGSAF